MPSNATRARVDWMPGDAAMEALGLAERLFSNLPRQEVIDKLVITGIWALQQPPWVPPPLFGKHRDRWRLPPSLQLTSPGHAASDTGFQPPTSRERVQSPYRTGTMNTEE